MGFRQMIYSCQYVGGITYVVQTDGLEMSLRTVNQTAVTAQWLPFSLLCMFCQSFRIFLYTTTYSNKTKSSGHMFKAVFTSTHKRKLFIYH